MRLIGETKKFILSEIAEKPMHGYLLSQRLSFPLSTIYGHLKDLRELELITIIQHSPHIIYKITEKGTLLLQVIQEGES